MEGRPGSVRYARMDAEGRLFLTSCLRFIPFPPRLLLPFFLPPASIGAKLPPSFPSLSHVVFA